MKSPPPRKKGKGMELFTNHTRPRNSEPYMLDTKQRIRPTRALKYLFSG
jgi:hypothetical protein